MYQYIEEDNEREMLDLRHSVWNMIASKKLSILYECPCEIDRKHNHHYDYNRPFEVIRLCPKCHGKEHKRLNLLKKVEPPVVELIKLICKYPKRVGICGYEWFPRSEKIPEACPKCKRAGFIEVKK